MYAHRRPRLLPRPRSMLEWDDNASDGSKAVIMQLVDSDSDLPVTPVDTRPQSDESVKVSHDTSSSINLSLSRHKDLESAFDDLAQVSQDISVRMRSLELNESFDSDTTVRPLDVSDDPIQDPDKSAALRQEIDGQIQKILFRSMASIASLERPPILPPIPKIPTIDAQAIIAHVYAMHHVQQHVPKAQLTTLPLILILCILKHLGARDRQSLLASCRYFRILHAYLPRTFGRRRVTFGVVA